MLLLDKPPGITSNTALMRVRRLFNAEKAGHTGTLDPLASGLLPVCFGEATKFARFLLDASKRYRVVVRFGVTTTTQDAEGDVVDTRPVTIGRGDVEAALSAFTGNIRQAPPAYSALKHQGRSHYEYARAGIDVPRSPRDVHIAELALVDWSAPLATLDVECSKGTYVRTLAADLGAALRCGAHVAQLRRTAAGGFVIDDAASFDFLEQARPEARDDVLLPVDALLRTLPRVDVDSTGAAHLRQGRALPRIDVDSIGTAHLRQGRALASDGEAGELLRAYAPTGALLGVVRVSAGALLPVRMTSSALPHPGFG